jgi:hypothetical protein
MQHNNHRNDRHDDNDDDSHIINDHAHRHNNNNDNHKHRHEHRYHTDDGHDRHQLQLGRRRCICCGCASCRAATARQLRRLGHPVPRVGFCQASLRFNVLWRRRLHNHVGHRHVTYGHHGHGHVYHIGDHTNDSHNGDQCHCHIGNYDLYNRYGHIDHGVW